MALSFTGCSKDDAAEPTGYKTYVIAAGAQYATKSLSDMGNVDAPVMRFAVVFDSSAIYKTQDPVNQSDINKLYGSSDCGSSDHHEHSARFGWRWFNDRLEIHAYTYSNKERHEAFIAAVELGKEYVYEIQFGEQEYRLMLDGKTVVLPRACNGNGKGNKLFPYFGGDEKAPHAITIKIKDLK